MAKKNTGLGRGLGALIPQKNPADNESVEEKKTVATPKSKTPSSEAVPIKLVEQKEESASVPVGVSVGHVAEVPIADIVVNPSQPRIAFRHQELEDLMNSIREHGIIQPLAVTKRDGGYELIAGERRFRASNMLGLKTVPVIVHETDDEGKLVLALIENIQRADLNPIEEAKGYERLVQEFDFTQEEVSKKVGKARSTVANTLRLLDLPIEIQDALSEGVIPAGSARAILSLKDKEAQLKFFKKLVTKQFSTRDVEEGVRKSKGGAPKKDPAVSAMEEQIRTAFGAKVEIKKKGEKGTVMISFYSDEEYKELVTALTKA